MSVDWYMTCGKCKECVHIAQDGMSGYTYTFYSGEPACMKTLGRFLKKHSLCHDSKMQMEQYVEDYIEWPWKTAKQALLDAGTAK